VLAGRKDVAAKAKKINLGNYILFAIVIHPIVKI